MARGQVVDHHCLVHPHDEVISYRSHLAADGLFLQAQLSAVNSGHGFAFGSDGGQQLDQRPRVGGGV